MKTLQQAFIIILMFLLFQFQSAYVKAQDRNREILPQEQKLVIEKAFRLLESNYIFPERIPSMEAVIGKKLKDGGYSKSTTVEDFLQNLNQDLEKLANDRHVDVFFDPVRVKQIEAEANNENDKPVYAPSFLRRAKFENFMVRKVERLDGNIGYFKFNAFVDPDLSKTTLQSAMNLLANSSALILDLRQNGGGDARTCSFLLNYFLPDSTLFMIKRSRADKQVSVFTPVDKSVWKLERNIPVYILTSKRTSSAAEAFAYTLQSFKRAVIVGDTTNGEANPGYLFAINSDMYIMIPAFENINPVTHSNWQGRGVIPDVVIASDKALSMSQAAAYSRMAEGTQENELKSFYDWMATGLMAEVRPFKISFDSLKKMQGEYADQRRITILGDKLYYERTGSANGKMLLIPLAENLFGVEGLPYFRIYFFTNNKGEVTGLEGRYDDGARDVSTKLR